jgi:FkbM family methyltransferase
VKTDGVNQQKGDNRRFLLSRLPQNSVGCEIGVWKGDFSEEILRMVKPGKLYLIDPWSYQPEFSHEWYGGTIAQNQKDMDAIYESVRRRFINYQNVQIIRKKTEELINEIPVNHLDWIYIDGNHQYEYVLRDLKTFFPLVKEGGIICGDDYDQGAKKPYPVTEAVNTFLKEGACKLLWIKSDQFFLQKQVFSFLADTGRIREYLEQHLDDAIRVMQSPLTDKYPEDLLKKILEISGNIADSQKNNWKAAWLIALVSRKLGAIDLVDKACKIVLSLNKEFWFARELPKHARGYYSQLGQDEFIEYYFTQRKPKSKMFVEVGAFDGKHYSNVRRLVEKHGWRGLSIEPVRKNFAKLCESYWGKDVKCIQAAVSNHTGTAEINVSTYPHLPEWGSDVASLSTEDNARWTKTYGAKWEKETIEVKTLTDIFSENGLKNVDLLSIDAEGHDVEVLEGLDFSQHKPQLVVVEYGDKRRNIAELLASKGYSLVYDNKQDLFFADVQSILTDYTTRNYAGSESQEPYAAIQDDVERDIYSYLKKNAENSLRIVIVGAYYGDEIERFLKRYPQAEIIAFEANPGTYNKLCEKYKAFSNVKCYPYAVSEQNGKMEFYENNLPGTGSILPMDGSSSAGKGQTIDVAKQYGMEQKEKFTVESIRLDDFEPLRSKPIDLLWCDVQGAELHVLKGAQKVLGNCSSLFLEVWFHATLYKNQARLADLEQYLAGQGFYLAGIGLDHKIGNGSGNSFWLSQRLGQRAIDETASYRVREGDTKSPDMTSVSNSSVKKPKIVGLVAARNEENIIGQCLRLLSQFTDAIVYLDDCSTDSSVAVVQSLAEQCRVERIITKDRWLRDEPGDRNKMLQAGREIGGTHFIVLDADEAFTSNFLLNHSLRNQILSLQPGDTLKFNWISLWKSTRQYRYDNSVWTDNYKPFVFCDDGQCSYSSEFIHTPRTPQDLAGRILKIEGYKYGVLHFQFFNWRNLLLKQAWYRCLEHIREPQKSIVEINKRYAPSKDETNIQLRKANEDWYRYYPDLNAGVFDKEDNWRAEQICGWLKEYGADFFKNLDIWDIITPDVAAVRNAAGGGLYLVSAIVSTYNSEKFIRGCLEDLESQTIADRLEIIVVNSASEQDEESIVKEFQKKYSNIVYIKTNKREGLYAAWNRAIKVASGRFLTNANTDDRHRKDALEVMSNVLLASPDASLVYGDQIVTDSPNPTFDNHHAVEVAKRPEFSRQRLLFGCCVGSQPMWRKSLHDEFGGFDETLTCAADWDFWLKIAGKHSFKHIDGFLGLYYRNENGIEHGRKIHSLYERYAVGKRYGNPYISVIDLCEAPGNPLVSVVMPAYNAQDCIARAIESVLIQNYRNFELIVVDDGSTDRTADNVRGFKDQRIKYFFKEKGGVASARNFGVKKSGGSFIVMLDSDDMMTPDYIARHLQVFERHPESDMVYCDDMLMDDQYKPIRVINRPVYPDQNTLISNLFRCGFPVVPFRTCIRKNVFDKIGLYDEQLIIAEDYDMMRRFAQMGLKMCHLPSALYRRRITAGSLSRKFNADKAKSHFEVVRRFTETFTPEQLFPELCWEGLSFEQKQLQVKFRTAVAFIAIGRQYISSGASDFVAEAIDQACAQLNECLKVEPQNRQIGHLWQKCRAIRARQLQSARRPAYQSA